MKFSRIVLAVLAAAILSTPAAAAKARSSGHVVITCDRFGCSDWAAIREKNTKSARRAARRAAKGQRAARHSAGIRKTPVRASQAKRGLVTMTCGGRTARVAARAKAPFERFCADLTASGYPIKFMGGWRPSGSCAGCNMHPKGLAIDINQVARGKVTVRMDKAAVSRMARAAGLVSGGDWCRGDLGHFELDIGRNAYGCGRNIYSAVEKYKLDRHISSGDL